jgi:hypothetical protein
MNQSINPSIHPFSLDIVMSVQFLHLKMMMATAENASCSEINSAANVLASRTTSYMEPCKKKVVVPSLPARYYT